ncbi:DNA-binding PadR family transcriptional regulator [Motilibacter peucedani]|uniref:DNA-binding PadR family transcriptional regulator n=1 Tax=Motilibacter peucedani TaxID=598650 RepID=A0A420XK11_9ACTN|nr:PadR family transcriptional regulator [Motilibacter peucedani]RKS68474.1 DNA-binding PadR family transcriptional regulator [Motilibacter peucedani]
MRHPTPYNPFSWPPDDSGEGRGRRGRRHHHPEARGGDERGGPDARHSGGRDAGHDERPHGRPFGAPEGLGPGFPGLPFGGRRGEGRRGGRGRGRGRAQRGDVRTATLLLLAEEPMHGYQLMQAMDERTGGAWRPSPGAIYPTINQLEDEGLVTTAAEGGRKLVTLTEAGRAHVEQQRTVWGDPFAALTADEADGPDLRGPLGEVAVAARQISHHGSPAQAEAAARVLAEARRSLYLILAEHPSAP